MIALEILSMVLVGALALAAVQTRDPLPQLLVMGLFGFALVVFLLVVQAPDVSLSYIVVAGAYPVMVLLTLDKVRDRDRSRQGRR